MPERSEKKYLVYLHVFPNGKKYYGITSNSKDRRWQNGLGYLGRPKSRMTRAVLKYGWNSMTHIVLLSGLEKEEAKALEIRLIADGKTTDPSYGYNVSAGGDETVERTAEARAKIGLANSRRVVTAETRAKMSLARKGRPAPPGTAERLRAVNLGRVRSAETRAKLSAAKKGVKPTPEARAKMRAAQLGRKLPAEVRAKISASNRRRKLSAETRAKIGAAHRGKPGHIPSPETRAKISAAHKGRAKSPETCARIRATIRAKKGQTEGANRG